MADAFEVVLDGELKDGEMRRVKAEGHDVLITKVNGRYYAIGNVCNHRGCYLSSGWMDDQTVVCGCHMSRFDVTDGKVLKGPASKPQQVYEVKVHANRAYLKFNAST